jgi:hypothetical protein
MKQVIALLSPGAMESHAMAKAGLTSCAAVLPSLFVISVLKAT